ncbi:MAG: terminase [Micavibrio sp.]|mgnify:CR=1 FL=1|nr:terminase [Micavibrio sp.]|tara:strand:+ start:2413 stop:2862 length:450 start_codon:yes stop_codon:yes gene_type:complete
MNTNTYTLKKERFLEYLAVTCNVSRSCRMAGVDRSDMYKLRKSDSYFAENWAQAIEIGVQGLEDEMHRRAFEGELITNQNGTYRKYSDTLAMFLMKAHKPEKYSDRYRTEILSSKKTISSLDDPKVINRLNDILNPLLRFEEGNTSLSS